MNVEVLYFDGCPNHEPLLERLGELLAQAGLATTVTLVDVPDHEAAQRQRFLGSPTVRVNGRDIEPGADTRTDFGLERQSASASGRRAMPRTIVTPSCLGLTEAAPRLHPLLAAARLDERGRSTGSPRSCRGRDERRR